MLNLMFFLLLLLEFMFSCCELPSDFIDSFVVRVDRGLEFLVLVFFRLILFIGDRADFFHFDDLVG